MVNRLRRVVCAFKALFFSGSLIGLSGPAQMVILCITNQNRPSRYPEARKATKERLSPLPRLSTVQRLGIPVQNLGFVSRNLDYSRILRPCRERMLATISQGDIRLIIGRSFRKAWLLFATPICPESWT